jgi:hypothetical protein
VQVGQVQELELEVEVEVLEAKRYEIMIRKVNIFCNFEMYT